MTSLDFEVAFVRVRIDSTRIVNVSVDDGYVSESLCRNLVQLPADFKPEGGVTSRRVVEYVRSVNLDDFHYLKRVGEISGRALGECMLAGKTHVLRRTFEKRLPCERHLARRARDTVIPRDAIV